jgi:uncharacterized membrane protein
MKSRFERNKFDRMRTDPEFYKWGIFYFNPQDSRIVLPKRNPWMGWTMNFANLWSYVIILFIIGIAILIGYFE